MGTRVQIHRTRGRADGAKRLMSGVTLSCSLAKPRVHPFGCVWLAGLPQGSPVCLLRAVL